MQHKGEIIEKKIRESGYSITRVAQLMGMSRNWMYKNVFSNPNVSTDYILRFGKVLNYDFSHDIKDLRHANMTVDLNEWMDLEGDYRSEKERTLYWKHKFFELLEKTAGL